MIAPRVTPPLAAAASAALLAAAPASASTLTITNPLVANFPPVTLNGTAQTVKAALDAFSVRDTRLIAQGWNVTVQATQFREVDGNGAYVSGGKTLPAGSLKMPAPTVTAKGTTSPPPKIQGGAPWPIDVANAVKIASAGLLEGSGTYNFSSVSLALTVPASAYAGTYRSDVTVSVASGP